MDSGPSAARGQISPHRQSQFRDSTKHLNRALCLPASMVCCDFRHWSSGYRDLCVTLLPEQRPRKACSQHLPAPWQSAFLPEAGASGFQLLICEKSSTAEAAQPNVKVMNPPQQKYEGQTHVKRKAPNESKNLAAMHLCLQGKKKKDRKKTHTTQGSSAPKPTNDTTLTHLTQS